jgi:hypothetical protein
MAPTIEDRVGGMERDIGEINKIVHSLHDNLMGHMDESTNVFVNGYFQRVQCMEENHRRCMEKKNGRFKAFLLVTKDVIVGIAILLLAYKVGIK